MSRSTPVALAAVCDRSVELLGADREHWVFHSFAIAPDQPTFDRLPDSAFSSPGRYIQEIFVRLVETRPPAIKGGCFIFNPYFALIRSSVLATVAALREFDLQTAPPAIIVDADGCPLGYFLPADFDIADARYLSFLSTTDVSLDAQLLKLVCFSDVAVHTLPHLRLARTARNGFDEQGLPRVYAWITQQAIRLLVASQHPDASVTKAERLKIPITAFMPHHAGDVLFFCLAFNLLNAPCQRIAVNRVYADIVQAIAPRLLSVELDTPPLNRNAAFAAGKALRDDDYFQAIAEQLPTDSFYIYCRPSRNYNTTEFHLLDHFGFALGHSPRSSLQLLLLGRSPTASFKSASRHKNAARILLHFDGGWPLKVYPQKQQTELIEMLLAQGYEMTVLAAAGYSHAGVETVTFSNLQDFVELANSHDALIGMDSFPCHYCVHVLDMPTICLFANTKPVNSNAPLSARYTYMEKGLSCRPCYAIAKCPVYGGTSCKNFSDPASVVAQLDKLLSGSVPTPHNLNRIEKANAPALSSPMTISLSFIRLQLGIAYFFPETSYLRLMVQEFALATQREGFRGAISRTMRFLIRKYFSLK